MVGLRYILPGHACVRLLQQASDVLRAYKRSIIKHPRHLQRHHWELDFLCDERIKIFSNMPIAWQSIKLREGGKYTSYADLRTRVDRQNTSQDVRRPWSRSTGSGRIQPQRDARQQRPPHNAPGTLQSSRRGDRGALRNPPVRRAHRLPCGVRSTLI